MTYYTFAKRTLEGAIDQLWYVVFYFTLPFTCNVCKVNIERLRDSTDWIIVDEYKEDDEWIIVDKPESLQIRNIFKKSGKL